MPSIQVQRLFEHLLGFGEILVVHILVATQRVGIGVMRVELNGSHEELESLFVFFLEGKAVADSNPGFGNEQRLVEGLVRQVAEVSVFLQVPQTTRVVLDAFHPVGFAFEGFLVEGDGILVADHFHVGLAHVGEHPSGFEVVFGQFLELLDGFEAVVVVELVVAVGQFPEQTDDVWNRCRVTWHLVI